MVSGFSIAASVSFSIAGKTSDVFGRRYILLSGMAFSILGSVSYKLLICSEHDKI
jgi:MFS family permease